LVVRWSLADLSSAWNGEAFFCIPKPRKAGCEVRRKSALQEPKSFKGRPRMTPSRAALPGREPPPGPKLGIYRAHARAGLPTSAPAPGWRGSPERAYALARYRESPSHPTV
jgi:hypothetical protein